MGMGRNHTEGEENLIPIFNAVDKYTTTHLHPPSRPNYNILKQVKERCDAAGLPTIASSDTMAKWIGLTCQIAKVKNVIEFGTLGAYGSIWIASMNPDLKITTIEYNPHHAKISRENIALAGMEDRIELLEGAAMDHLPKIKAEVANGTRPRFGLSYIDADKINNWNYFDASVEMSVPGGIVLCDNVVFNGDLVKPDQQEDNAIIGAREVIEKAGKDSRVDGVVLQVIADGEWDGVLFAKVKE